MVGIYRDEGYVDMSFIDEFGEDMGYTLPFEYKALLSKHNCLYPEENNFNFFDSTEDCESSRDIVFFGYGDDIKSYQQITRVQQSEHCQKHIIVFGGTAGGDYVCFDYRANPETDNPAVVVMFHDYYDDDGKMFICPVANSFEEFMDSLYKPGDE